MSEKQPYEILERRAMWQSVGTILVAALINVGLLHILRQFDWFQRFSSAHDFLASLVPMVVFLPLFLFVGRKSRHQAHRAFSDALRRNQVKRASLSSRACVFLIALLLIAFALSHERHERAAFLFVGATLLGLSALYELNVLLRPGDTVTPDPHDELLVYMRARTLRFGYAISVLSLLTLSVIALFAIQYVSMAVPVALALSLLLPSMFFSRIDRRADIDE